MSEDTATGLLLLGIFAASAVLAFTCHPLCALIPFVMMFTCNPPKDQIAPPKPKGSAAKEVNRPEK